MTLSEWILFIAVIDGPLIAVVYMIWKRLKIEIRMKDES
jgi:hypothetical protein